MLTLDPLNESSFSEFFEKTVAACAADNMAAGRLKPDASARSLYASLGYVVTNMNMAKPLAGK